MSINELNGGAIAGGLGTVVRSLEQSVVFTAYTRVVVPVDGFVYWRKGPDIQTVSGILHYSTDIEQEKDQTTGASAVAFTTKLPLVVFSSQSSTIWVGSITTQNGQELRFYLNANAPYSDNARLLHYRGKSITPIFVRTLLEPNDALAPFYSNSMALWMQLGVDAGVTTHPAYLAALNEVPPYVAVDVESSTALQAAPKGGNWLRQDKVTLWLHGLSADAAASYYQKMLQGPGLGFAATPTLEDAAQPEQGLQTIAQTKKITALVNYQTIAAQEAAVGLIKHAGLTVNTA